MSEFNLEVNPFRYKGSEVDFDKVDFDNIDYTQGDLELTQLIVDLMRANGKFNIKAYNAIIDGLRIHVDSCGGVMDVNFASEVGGGDE